MAATTPSILVLGGNFAGLGAAQKIRKYAGDEVRITVIDRKTYLLFVPNISGDVFEGRDPAMNQRMDLVETLAHDDIDFIHGEVGAIDVATKRVSFTPFERPGAELEAIDYDYLVIAVGNRLAFDRIEGFADHGHSVTDIFHGNRLRAYLEHDYAGGPIAAGSARFHQGGGADGLEPYPGGSIPRAMAACEGPPIEIMLSAATWLKNHGFGGAEKVTVFTPAKTIAEDAGEKVVEQLLNIATEMGFHYVNNGKDITRLTAEGIELANGTTIEAELKIVLPDWVAHDFLVGLPICDSMGFREDRFADAQSALSRSFRSGRLRGCYHTQTRRYRASTMRYCRTADRHGSGQDECQGYQPPIATGRVLHRRHGRPAGFLYPIEQLVRRRRAGPKNGAYRAFFEAGISQSVFPAPRQSTVLGTRFQRAFAGKDPCVTSLLRRGALTALPRTKSRSARASPLASKSLAPPRHIPLSNHSR